MREREREVEYYKCGKCAVSYRMAGCIPRAKVKTGFSVQLQSISLGVIKFFKTPRRDKSLLGWPSRVMLGTI